MAATKVKTTRKAPCDETQNFRLENIERAVDRIEKRVFNGLGIELRGEMHKSIASVRNLVISLLVSLLLGLIGIIIEGRVSTAERSKENDRNYEAIIKTQQKIIELHGERGRIDY